MSTDMLTHVTRAGDRWDLLAYQYYGDARGYERIIVANPDVAIDATLPTGITLLIPIIDGEIAPDIEALPPWLR